RSGRWWKARCAPQSRRAWRPSGSRSASSTRSRRGASTCSPTTPGGAQARCVTRTFASLVTRPSRRPAREPSAAGAAARHVLQRVGGPDREGERVSPHPLIERARDREVRQASRFRDAAEKLAGEGLRKEWEEEVASAPRRHQAGKRYLAPRKRPPARLGDTQSQLALALLRHAADPARGLLLPDRSSVQLVGCRVPLRAAPPDPQQADDPNRGIGEIDLLGLSDTGRLSLIGLAHVEPDAARAGTGETPLRALLEGLASAAVAWANRDALRQEIADAVARELGDEAPLLLLLGAPRYWELCRRRSAQKGAAWIHQMDRLAREIEAGAGVRVQHLALRPLPGALHAAGRPRPPPTARHPPA